MRAALAETIKSLREQGFLKTQRREKAVCWRERDYLDGEVTAGVVILPTSGCAWGLAGGCAMCGYVYDSTGISQEALYTQFTDALERLGDVEYLKIFNSGSFFDYRELEASLIDRLFAVINEKEVKRVQVESRPEFLGKDALDRAKASLDAELEVGIGLETSSDYIRETCVNKGFTLGDFRKALRTCKSCDVNVKAYLLVKPPFLSEREAIEDAITSAVDAVKLGASRISFNPTAVHRYTFVEYLWKRREYSPPWLWSLAEILRRTREKIKAPLLCHPTGAGKIRGPHNCGRCDGEVYKAIVDFSATQEDEHLERLRELSCECRDAWRAQLELEQFAQGSFRDLRR